MKPAHTPLNKRNRAATGSRVAGFQPTVLARAVHGAVAMLALGAGTCPAQVWAQSVSAEDNAPVQLKPGSVLQEELPAAVRDQLPSFVSGQRMEGKTDAVTVIEGEVELRRHDTVIRADRVEFDQNTNDAVAKGHVLVNRNGDRFTGPELQLNVETYKGHFSQPTYQLLKNDGNGDASRIDFVDRDNMVIHDGRYSTCARPPGGSWMPAWLIRASTIELDNAEEVGVAKGGVLEFQGVPILAAPYLTFPLTDKRKSGVLPPTLTIDNQSGVAVTTPYYLNLAPNMDATLAPTVMTRRGVDLGGELRYLEPRYVGRLRASYMPSDRLRDSDRWSYSLQHNQRLVDNVGGGAVGLRLNLNRVGDDNFWRDFPRSMTSLTSRLLHNDANVSWTSGPWSVNAGAYTWQDLQDASAPFVPPYDRLPSLGVNYNRTDLNILGSGGWDVSVQTNVTRFKRSILSTSGTSESSSGDRSLVLAEVTRRWQAPGWFVQPKAIFNGAQYQFDNAAGSRTSASRGVPTVSLDSGLIFERPASYFGRDYTQTLEPRAFFTWTPYRDQNALPNYDSGARDFNLATMFTEHAFNGNDRISDTKAMTLGVSSRLLNTGTGAELVRLGVAQRLLLQDQNVTLPGKAPVTERLSDMMLSARVQWDPLWSFDSNVQYNPKSRESVRTTVGGRYTPGPFKVVSAAYRIQRGVSEQIDLGWQWPLSSLWGDTPARVPGRALGPGQWYTVGRMNYSLPDRKMIDLVAGFEYDAGCWLGRVVLSRLQQSSTSANQSILFQLEFSGFSRIGASSLQTLQANVPKYQYLREEISSPSRFQQYD